MQRWHLNLSDIRWLPLPTFWLKQLQVFDSHLEPSALELIFIMPADSPFRLRECTIAVDGKHLGEDPWVPELFEIDGDKSFITLDKNDRDIARAFNFNRSECRPMLDVSVFAYLANMRDNAVDTMIVNDLVKKDPMGRRPNAAVLRGREKAFATAEIGSSVDLVVPGKLKPDGTMLAPIRIKMASSARRGVNPCVKLTAELLEWLSVAAHMEFDAKHRRSVSDSNYDDMDLPDLPPPLKYRKRKDALAMFSVYHDRDGKQRTHQETITKWKMSEDGLSALVPQIVEKMQKFLETQSHNPVGVLPGLDDQDDGVGEIEHAVEAE
jgi:hypothetical protein